MTENEKKIDVYFMQLILTFQTAAWQQLGKLKNPLTDKIEVNLNQARFSVDILEMLQRKTEGNRSEEETTMLKKAIQELQLNYIAEVNKEKREAGQKPSEEPPKEEKKSEPIKAETKKEKKKEGKSKKSSGKKKSPSKK